MLDQIILHYYNIVISNEHDFIGTPESILRCTKDAFDWVYNDLCGVLYETKYHRTHFRALTNEQLVHYYENYTQFEDYLDIPLDDVQAQKHGLKMLCEVFTQEELATLLG